MRGLPIRPFRANEVARRGQGPLWVIHNFSLMMDRLFSRRSWLLARLTPGLLIGAISLWWAMRGLELPVVLRTLAMASPDWIMVSLVGVVAVVGVKAARWGVLYRLAEPQPSFWELFSVLVAAQMVNVLIPIRLGELIRVGLMKRAGQPGAITLSTLVMEKVLDLVAAGLIAVSLVALTVAPVWLRERASGVLLIGLTLIVGLLLIWRLRKWLEECLAGVLAPGSLLPAPGQGWLLNVLGALLKAFGTLTDTSSLARVVLWTLTGWLLSLLTMMALLAAFGLHLPLSAAVVMMLAVSSSNIAPSPPALVGVMHLIAVVVLGQYGVAQSVAVGFGLVLNVVTVAPLIILGGWALGSRPISLSAGWLHTRSVDELIAE